MKRFLIAILSVFLLGCNSNKESSKTDYTVKKIEDENSKKEFEYTLKEWSWNETVLPPEKSEISNFKYIPELLFRSWTWSYGDKNEIAFTIDKEVLKEHSLEYKYTINQDSIRIFTNDEYGDGVDRGIVRRLTEDTLIIDWSTGDISIYVPINK